MKLIFTFPPPRLRRAIIPLKNPKNLSEQTGPPHNALEDEALRNVLPEDVWRYLTVLYVERRGINLRNDLAHGLVSHSAFTQTLSDRVFHSLLVMSLIRRTNTAESVNAP